MPIHFGAHMSIAGGMEQAAERGVRAGCDSIQVFVKSSHQWKARPFRPGEPEAFREAVRSASLREVVAHNCYLVNLASPDPALWKRGLRATGVELDRCAALGIERLVIHPGNHMGRGEEKGIRRLVRALDRVRETAAGRVRILLETTAGQGTGLGWRFEHLRDVLGAVEDDGWLGVCLDTCHVFAAGWDLARPEGYEAMMEALAAAVGVGRVEAVHVNDSKTDCGSRVDRHAHIGKGKMGREGFRRFVRDARWEGRSFLLETPKGPDLREDRRNLRLLRRLAAS